MKLNICQLLSLCVLTGGLIVTFGWVTDISLLKSISDDFVTMKFTTSISFVMSSLIVLGFLNIRNKSNGRTEPSILLIVIVVSQIVFMMVMLQEGSEITKIFTDEEAINTVGVGIPSVGTIFCFILLMLVGVGSVFHSVSILKNLRWVGLIVMLTGLLAVIGYVFDEPKFYFYNPEISTAMAIHTAIMFIMLGSSIVIPFCIRIKK